MRRRYTLFLALALVFSGTFFSGCKDKEPDDLCPCGKQGSILFDFNHVFNNEAITFNSLEWETAQGDTLNFVEMKYILSNFILEKLDGTKDTIEDAYAYLAPSEGRNSFELENVPDGDYTGITFMVGLDSSINHGDPAQWESDHPLNVTLNKMHWGWAGGYRFFTLDGYYMNNGDPQGIMTYHVATSKYRQQYTFNTSFNINSNTKTAKYKVHIDEFFKSPQLFSPKTDGPVSHSGDNDPIMDKLHGNMSDIYELLAVE